MNKITTKLAAYFTCSRCWGIMKEVVRSIGKLGDEVETVNEFYYLRDKLNASGGCEAAVTARLRMNLVRFRDCRELLLGNIPSVEDEREDFLLLHKIGNITWKRDLVFTTK